ncbi:MAG: Ribonuclease 3 [Firmicutes bacterium]|nr:Ribonuclease 3 [Bacillota bacterium]
MSQINELTTTLGFSLEDEVLVLQALTHSSYVNTHVGECDNERLEFLGDAVLALLCSETLYTMFPALNEGQLSRLRAYLVREATLALIAKRFNIALYMRLGKSAAGSGGHERPRILAGCVEALLGAAFLCGGVLRARQLFVLLYREHLAEATELWAEADAKSALQELAPESVRYALLEASGPDHDRSYRTEVFVKGFSQGVGEGKSKKQAEQAAAFVALRNLRSNK